MAPLLLAGSEPKTVVIDSMRIITTTACKSLKQAADEQMALFDVGQPTTPPAASQTPPQPPQKPTPPIPHGYRDFRGSMLFQALWAARPQMAAAAQKVYDEWQQDENGEDADMGVGGICQDIAAAIADVVSGVTHHEATTVSAACGEQHVWCVAYTTDEAYHVDIPYSIYERGGGYTWKKVPDVKFDPDHITFETADPPGPEGYPE